MSRRMLGVLAGAVLALALWPAAGRAAVQLVQVGDFTTPTFVTAPPGDASRVFVVQRSGQVRVIRDGVTLPTPFLDLGAGTSTDGERGLLSMAFAPDYATSGRFWIFFTDATNGTLRIEEGHRDPANPDVASPARVLTLAIPHRQNNHNGGQLAVGADGDLYIGVGDGGQENDPNSNGQDLTVRDETGASGQHALLGKILRIAPNPAGGYAIPAGNPFPAPAAEVWAYGLRNPYRFSVDPATGQILVGDVGQDAVEEVDLLPPGVAGLNFGWSYLEGNQAGPHQAPAGFSATGPVLVHPHSAGWCSIIGGVVDRDPALPDLEGRYIYGDYCLGKIWSAAIGAANPGDADVGLPTISQLVSFGTDACGRVYAVSLDGPVYRLADSGACALASAPAAGSPSGPPKLTVRVSHVQRFLRTNRVRLRVGCDRTCTLRTGGAFSIRRTARASAARGPFVLRRVRRILAGGAVVRVQVSLTARNRRALRRALARGGRKVTARITLRATGTGGAPRHRTVLVRLRR